MEWSVDSGPGSFLDSSCSRFMSPDDDNGEAGPNTPSYSNASPNPIQPPESESIDFRPSLGAILKGLPKLDREDFIQKFETTDRITEVSAPDSDPEVLTIEDEECEVKLKPLPASAQTQTRVIVECRYNEADLQLKILDRATGVWSSYRNMTKNISDTGQEPNK